MTDALFDGVVITVLTQAYLGIAILVTRVSRRRRMAHGLEPSWLAASLVGIAWPLAAVLFGFVTIVTGNAGIYGEPHNHDIKAGES